MKNIIKEFKEFAIKGSVIDLAVGVIIGGAFGRVVTSLVNDVLMPPLGALTGSIDFSEQAWILKTGTSSASTIALRYGAFLNTAINFILVAAAIFLLIKQINRLKQTPPPPPPATKKCPFCVSDIPVSAVRCPYCTSNVTDR